MHFQQVFLFLPFCVPLWKFIKCLPSECMQKCIHYHSLIKWVCISYGRRDAINIVIRTTILGIINTMQLLMWKFFKQRIFVLV